MSPLSRSFICRQKQSYYSSVVYCRARRRGALRSNAADPEVSYNKNHEKLVLFCRSQPVRGRTVNVPPCINITAVLTIISNYTKIVVRFDHRLTTGIPNVIKWGRVGVHTVANTLICMLFNKNIKWKQYLDEARMKVYVRNGSTEQCKRSRWLEVDGSTGEFWRGYLSWLSFLRLAMFCESE